MVVINYSPFNRRLNSLFGPLDLCTKKKKNIHLRRHMRPVTTTQLERYTDGRCDYSRTLSLRRPLVTGWKLISRSQQLLTCGKLFAHLPCPSLSAETYINVPAEILYPSFPSPSLVTCLVQFCPISFRIPCRSPSRRLSSAIVYLLYGCGAGPR